MKDLKLNGHKVRIYDDIEELPMVRFHRYNHMVLVDAGIGSDLSDFDGHIERVVRYIRKGDNENAAKEMENMRQNVFNILQGQSVKDLSFACLVAEIDGTPQTDISQEGLMKIVELLGGAPRKELADAYQSAKKKIDDALVLYFPSLFDDVTVREYYDIMKRLTMVTLKMVEGETEELKAERERLREKLVLYHKPKTYTGHDGLEVKHDKEYEAMCISITKETGKDAKLMTVQEFYAAYEYIQEKLRKAQNKAR